MPHRCLLEIDCRIKPEKRREFRLNISTAFRGSTKDSGRAFVYEDQNEPGHMLIVEEWPSMEELKAYLASEDFLSTIGGFRVLGEVRDCRIVDLSMDPVVTPRPVPIARGLRGWRHLDIHVEEGPPSAPISAGAGATVPAAKTQDSTNDFRTESED